MGSYSCHAQAQCENVVGSYNCSCLSGYTGDGTSYCDRKYSSKQGWILFSWETKRMALPLFPPARSPKCDILFNILNCWAHLCMQLWSEIEIFTYLQQWRYKTLFFSWFISPKNSLWETILRKNYIERFRKFFGPEIKKKSLKIRQYAFFVSSNHHVVTQI